MPVWTFYWRYHMLSRKVDTAFQSKWAGAGDGPHTHPDPSPLLDILFWLTVSQPPSSWEGCPRVQNPALPVPTTWQGCPGSSISLGTSFQRWQGWFRPSSFIPHPGVPPTQDSVLGSHLDRWLRNAPLPSCLPPPCGVPAPSPFLKFCFI